MSQQARVKARRYDTGEPVSITIENGQIAQVDPVWPRDEAHEWPFVAPGFFDLQINGYGGTWFSDAAITPDIVLETLDRFFQFGITRLCPTLITNSFEALEAAFAAIRTACEREDWADRMVAGCHLEGPYISAEDGPRGAHPSEHVRPADSREFRKLQEVSGDRICLVTLAPESRGAVPLIRELVGSGVTVSIGHTAANTQQIAAAAEAGAKLSTHLGNGAHSVLPRHPNYIWDQLGDDRLWASIIVDGHHLPPSVVRAIIAAKTPHRTILTCDASGWAGCPAGVYENALGKVEILPDGKTVVFGQREYLAGSAALTDTCVSQTKMYTNVSLSTAMDMASLNPARLLGVDEVRLRKASRADLILFELTDTCRLKIIGTVADGILRHGGIPGF